MAKPARGLPDDFALDLPEEKPVVIGDFLDEEPPSLAVVRKQPTHKEEIPAERDVRTGNREEGGGERTSPRAFVRRPQQPSVIRYQLNLTPRSKTMLEELVKHVRTYSPQADARTSEVFQGIMTLLHNALDELELADLPRRGAWGSVTAKNFPGALSVAFEKAIMQAARKRRETT